MTRKILLLAFLGLFCFGVGILAFYLTKPQPVVAEAQIINPPPKQAITPTSLRAIPLAGLDGNVYTLGDWKQPVLIVNFWAPWCIPCRREIPALIALQNEYESKLQILGLVFDSAENATSFAAEYEMNYPSFLVGSQVALYSEVFDNHSGALPFTAIIDQARTIRYTHTGEISLEKLREELLKSL